MQPDVIAASETAFEITYQDFLTSRVNPEFRGKGQLLIRPSGPTFVFSGHKREATGLLKRPLEIEFRPEHIRNVVVNGRSVQFVWNLASKEHDKPFVFFCRNAAEAAAVQAALPGTQDEAFVAGSEFIDKVKQLHAGANPWFSVTSLIVALNIVAFVVMGFLGAGWLEAGDLTPYMRYGANRADVTTDGQWWRIVASMFLHFGVLHLGLNMWALVKSGQLAEKLFGRVSFAVAYLGSGIAGSFATLIWHHDKPLWSAGASGAVFGVYGALLGYMLREKHALPKAIFQPLFKSTLAFAGYNLLYGLVQPGIDNAAHLGGLVAGILLGWLLALPIDAEARIRRGPARLAMAGATIVLFSAAGVAFAPRYDYRLADEITWQRTNEAPSAREKDIIRQQQATLATYVSGKDRGDMVRWLQAEAIPFYTEWRKDIVALDLAPGRRTEKRREGLTKILTLKIAAYEELLAAAGRGDRSGIAEFQNAEKTIAAEISKLAGR